MSTYKGQALGTIGDFGCYSFHETKNYSMGEGGALLIRNPEYIERAEIIGKKGPTVPSFSVGRLINTPGWTQDPLICPEI